MVIAFLQLDTQKACGGITCLQTAQQRRRRTKNEIVFWAASAQQQKKFAGGRAQRFDERRRS